MALPVSRIGIDQFMSLYGQLEPPGDELEINQRPGVAGTEFLATASRGQPFTLISRVDCASYADAQHTLKLYKEVHVNASIPAVPVTQSDYSTFNSGYLCKVLNVRLLDIHRSPVIVGGLQYTSGAILECEWTLLSVAL